MSDFFHESFRGTRYSRSMKLGTSLQPALVANRQPQALEAPTSPDTVATEQTDSLQWSTLQRPAGQLTVSGEGTLEVEKVRWALKEEGPAADWPGVFSDAKVDPSHVKNVYLGVKPFAPDLLAAHDVLIFEMDEDHPVVSSDGRQDSGLVLSMEAKLAQGDHYAIKKTLTGKYPVLYQLETWSELVQKTTRRENHDQILYKLDLTQDQNEQLLKNALEVACADRKDEKYNLFTNSCHSAAVDLVNSVVDEDHQMKRWLLPHVYNPLALFPAQGDILFAGKDLFADQPRLVIHPDSELHPAEAHPKSSVIGKALKAAASSSVFGPACMAVGAMGGTLAALSLSQISPLLSVPIGLGVGAKLGHFIAETTERRVISHELEGSQVVGLSPSQAIELSRNLAAK
jgi:hypothetical protein